MSKVSIEKLIEIIKDYNPEEVDVVRRTYEFASELHKGQKRQSGDDYITHPLNVAYILAEMHADRDTVCAGLLHDTLEDTHITKEEIAEYSTIPVVVIGGINKNTIPMLKGIKIDGYAMISPILAENNIAETTKKLKTIIDNNKYVYQNKEKK